jgi:hypothetical protein
MILSECSNHRKRNWKHLHSTHAKHADQPCPPLLIAQPQPPYHPLRHQENAHIRDNISGRGRQIQRLDIQTFPLLKNAPALADRPASKGDDESANSVEKDVSPEESVQEIQRERTGTNGDEDALDLQEDGGFEEDEGGV